MRDTGRGNGRPVARPASGTPREPRGTAAGIVAIAILLLVILAVGGYIAGVVSRPTGTAAMPSPGPTRVGNIAAEPTVTPPDPIVAVDTAVRSAVMRSNTAWTTALETASTTGLYDVKIGASLQETIGMVDDLQRYNEHWRIHLDSASIGWVHLLSATTAEVLLHKANETRLPYKNGGRRRSTSSVDRTMTSTS